MSSETTTGPNVDIFIKMSGNSMDVSDEHQLVNDLMAVCYNFVDKLLVWSSIILRRVIFLQFISKAMFAHGMASPETNLKSKRED